MARCAPVTGGYYHVYNRGVEKRRTFEDRRDYSRFLVSLTTFNAPESVQNFGYDLLHSTAALAQGKPAEPLVDIIAYALMPNHFHLLLRQRVDEGIAAFIQKVVGGYTMYFNKRHERSGVLFQGKYKARPVSDEQYLHRLVVYQHVNPLELMQSDWKKRGCRNVKQALRFLQSAPWSSYPSYLRGLAKGCEPCLNTDMIRQLGLPVGKQHRDAVKSWIATLSRSDLDSPIEVGPRYER